MAERVRRPRAEGYEPPRRSLHAEITRDFSVIRRCFVVRFVAFLHSAIVPASTFRRAAIKIEGVGRKPLRVRLPPQHRRYR
jgi:hypothetical protein